ncbi:hypothetical protein NEIPOLOT_00735 [Neisseria polysaccharea ATCC 43768]|nr:hypothetical protein NEIPOLOT_00735 [Neisseria polysaccharea ATCC 43768]
MPEPSFPQLFVIPTTFRHSRHFSSFPRRRESRISDFQIIFEYCCCSKVWIPACAGMTAVLPWLSFILTNYIVD